TTQHFSINDHTTTHTYTLSLHDALPISSLTYTQGANEVDLSNFDDDGFKSSMVVSRTRTLTFECNYLVDEDTKELNPALKIISRSEEHTSELQSRENLVCRLLLEKKKKK